MTDAAPGGTPTPVSPDVYKPLPGASADLTITPQQQARGEINLLKADGEWVKRYLNGDPAARTQLHTLQMREAANPPGSVGSAPTPEAQRGSEANTLAAMGLPRDVTEHYAAGKPVGATEYQQAVALWNSRKQDPEWRAAVARGEHKATQELRLLQVIRSSRIDPSMG
jgi:hypothetical protein